MVGVVAGVTGVAVWWGWFVAVGIFGVATLPEQGLIPAGTGLFAFVPLALLGVSGRPLRRRILPTASVITLLVVLVLCAVSLGVPIVWWVALLQALMICAFFAGVTLALVFWQSGRRSAALGAAAALCLGSGALGIALGAPTAAVAFWFASTGGALIALLLRAIRSVQPRSSE